MKIRSVLTAFLIALTGVRGRGTDADALAVSGSKPGVEQDVFENSLGMKFAPVAVPGEEKILFSVWDTRVQDYEVFVRDTRRDWPEVAFPQGPTHPAVMVSWLDSRDFCAWLTDRERKSGVLTPDKEYRLPSDFEWSCAAGIGVLEDRAKLPSEKNGRVKDVFPWGTTWPPPSGAGNYAGSEMKPTLASGRYNYIKETVAGYRDGFVNTSPVGSFAANRFGLFDLGGNTWQWCEDWYDATKKTRVLRGASWNDSARQRLFSSNRAHDRPDYRGYDNGFRCVLVISRP